MLWIIREVRWRENYFRWSRITTTANYYKQLQESMKLHVKGDTPRNIKTRLIHAYDKSSFFHKSSRVGEIVYYDMDYREKVFLSRRKLRKLGSLLKAKLKNSP